MSAYEVSVADVAARPTAVVAATTTWPEFPTLWKGLLDEVWACLRAGGIDTGCRNVMLYRDEVPHVEVGVELTRPCALTGRVVPSALPAGQVAMATHRGPYGELDRAHRAVLDWCAAHRRPAAGPRWEVYGPHRDDPAERCPPETRPSPASPRSCAPRVDRGLLPAVVAKAQCRCISSS